jgi:peptide/nickel transport system substrate-binding protein
MRSATRWIHGGLLSDDRNREGTVNIGLTKDGKLSRRAALGVVGSASLALLAACAPIAPATPAKSSTSAPAAGSTAAPSKDAGQPRSGGTLRYGSDLDVNRLDPHFRLNDVHYEIYDRLTQYDANHTPQPMLAESWEVAPDFKSIKFNLRKGVTFHNGREMDAEAVKFNSERARDLPNTQLDEAKWWNSIETPDKYTVVFKSDKPRPLAFDFFEYLNIAEPSTAADPKQAIGTGPFKFVEWNQGQTFTLTKNTSYWLTGKPLLDGIVMSVVTDPQAMVARLETGELDVAIVPANDFIRLKDNPAYAPYTFSAGNVAVLGVQCQTPPWDNKKARQALHYALDRGRWANTVNRGLETASALPWAKTSAAYDEAKANAYPFDIEKAKALLKDAGVSGTFNQDVLLQTGNAQYASFAQILQGDLAKLGVTLSIKALDSAAYLDQINNWRYQGFWLGGGSFAHLDPASAFTKSRAFSTTGNSSAFTTPANAAAVALIERATSEIDPAKRKLIYGELNDMLLDESYVLTLSPLTNRLLTTAKVRGITSTLHFAQKWWEAWLAA